MMINLNPTPGSFGETAAPTDASITTRITVMTPAHITELRAGTQ